ncbi:hypothetical protein Mapa_008866 [Marchantia paleacea]|nr:hypothetical protein Mapa_008866 [Marchantia paleacea]
MAKSVLAMCGTNGAGGRILNTSLTTIVVNSISFSSSGVTGAVTSGLTRLCSSRTLCRISGCDSKNAQDQAKDEVDASCAAKRKSKTRAPIFKSLLCLGGGLPAASAS